MGTDQALVAGLVLALLAIPSVFSAVIDGRLPKLALLLVAVAAGLIAYAVMERPGGYTLEEVPNAVVRVVGTLIR